ncbi:MAG: hypothetical protein EXS37_12550 [Opitutus sp.]|nr:hypothetical protein [Opitutus sp.]
MDDEHQDLEAELKRLRPAALPNELLLRVERQLADEPGTAARPNASMHWIWAVALPVAAAVSVMWVQFSNRPAPTIPSTVSTVPATLAFAVATRHEPEPMKPVAAENLLISASDEGLVTLNDGTTARRERLQFVDTITWKNPRTNASLTWSVPREEIRVVPISFQ